MIYTNIYLIKSFFILFMYLYLFISYLNYLKGGIILKNKKLLALLMSGLLAVSMVGCGKKDKTEEPAPDKSGDAKTETPEVSNEPTVGGTITVGVTEMSGNFNPAYYSSAYDAVVVDLVFDSLITMNVDGIYEPSAADGDWTVSEDGKDITFKLRKDMKFSDGEPVTADDIIFTYKFLSDGSYTGRYGSYAQDLVGYEEYFADSANAEFKGVTKNDDYSVTFHFKEGYRTNIANCGFYIMPEHYYGASWKPGDTSSIEAITSEPKGSGAYTLKNYLEGQLAALERNPDYYGEGYYIQNVVCKFVDETTDILELTSGEVDMLPGVIEPEKINQAKATDFLTYNDYDRSGYGYVKFNCEYGPTAEKAVRQALYYSFNVKEFVESYYKDSATGDVLASVQYHPFSQVSWAIDDALLSEMTEYDFDMDKAAALLDEAGWKVNANGKREKDGKLMELNIAAMPDHSILNTLIPMWQRDWEQGLGVTLNIAYMEFNSMLDYVMYNSDANVDKWSLYFMATSINTPDPDTLWSTFHSSQIGSGKDNSSRYNNPELDKLLDEGRTIIDIDEAKPVYQKMAKLLNEEAVMVPVYANTYFDIYNKKIQDLETSPFCDWVKALRHAYIPADQQ